jgi:signal peptidase
MRALRGVRRAGGLLLRFTAGLVAGLVLAAGLPVLFGLHSFTVLSGSMRPTLQVGDVTVTRPIPARDARVGDIVTFHDPGDRTRLVTHRITTLHLAGDQAIVTTKGDANNHAEHWTLPASGTVGRVAFHLPLIGWALVPMHGRNARLLLVVLPALLLGLIELGRIWRPSPPDPEPADALA